MKLEVGMYIRINGFISKIGHINTSKKGNTYIQFKQPNGLLITMNTKFLDDEKASNNIIDLIEVGDYVNGEKVTRIRPPYILGDEELDCAHISSLNGEEVFEDIEIKSIVTKEMFSSVEYRVETN